MTIPTFEVNIKDGTLYLEFPPNVPQLLLLDGEAVLMDVFRHELANQSTINKCAYFLRKWLYNKLSTGELYHDRIRNFWRYGRHN